jgi:hypothetical protein
VSTTPVTPWWKNWNLEYTDNQFGPFFGGGSVQEAFYQTLELWFPTYIAEMNRKLGGEILTDVPQFRTEPDYRSLSSSQQCQILVNVPHTVGTPENFQAGVRAQWRVNVMVFVYGSKDWQETQALTYAYATTLRSLILQQRGLGGIAQTTTWEGEEYLEGEHSSTRTTGIAHVTFVVTIGNVNKPFGGLPASQFAPVGANTGPTLQPVPDQPDVETYDITITEEAID